MCFRLCWGRKGLCRQGVFMSDNSTSLKSYLTSNLPYAHTHSYILAFASEELLKIIEVGNWLFNSLVSSLIIQSPSALLCSNPQSFSCLVTSQLTWWRWYTAQRFTSAVHPLICAKLILVSYICDTHRVLWCFRFQMIAQTQILHISYTFLNDFIS